MFVWFDAIGLAESIHVVRGFLHPYTSIIPNWVFFSLPDALWTYSFVSTYMLLWKNFKEKYVWLIVPIFTSVGVEILQGFRLFQGTFDWVDLFACIGATVISILIINNKRQYEKYI